MRASKFSPRIRGELEGGKIKPVSFSTKASGIVKYLEKPKLKLGKSLMDSSKQTQMFFLPKPRA